MSADIQMPKRLPEDGQVFVRRASDEKLLIGVTTKGEEQTIECSEYNAWRVFGFLSLMLGIKLPAKLGQKIKF